MNRKYLPILGNRLEDRHKVLEREPGLLLVRSDALVDLGFGGVLSESAEHVADLLNRDPLIALAVEISENLATISQIVHFSLKEWENQWKKREMIGVRGAEVMINWSEWSVSHIEKRAENEGILKSYLQKIID